MLKYKKTFVVSRVKFRERELREVSHYDKNSLYQICHFNEIINDVI